MKKNEMEINAMSEQTIQDGLVLNSDKQIVIFFEMKEPKKKALLIELPN